MCTEARRVHEWAQRERWVQAVFGCYLGDDPAGEYEGIGCLQRTERARHNLVLARRGFRVEHSSVIPDAVMGSSIDGMQKLVCNLSVYGLSPYLDHLMRD
jgi:hypothetical protein